MMITIMAATIPAPRNRSSLLGGPVAVTEVVEDVTVGVVVEVEFVVVLKTVELVDVVVEEAVVNVVLVVVRFWIG